MMMMMMMITNHWLVCIWCTEQFRPILKFWLFCSKEEWTSLQGDGTGLYFVLHHNVHRDQKKGRKKKIMSIMTSMIQSQCPSQPTWFFIVLIEFRLEGMQRLKMLQATPLFFTQPTGLNIFYIVMHICLFSFVFSIFCSLWWQWR